MKQIMILLMLIVSIGCFAQKDNPVLLTYDDFEKEIIAYKPQRKTNVSLKDYNQGIFKLNETKSAVQNNPENFTYADYWNIAMAFVNLDETSKNIDIAFKKAIELDSESICTIVKAFGNSDLDNRIPETFYSFLSNCSYQNRKEDFDLESYVKKNRLDLHLVQTINSININDQIYRDNDSEDQIAKRRIMDKQNQIAIDSLYNIHKSYIGKKLVGKKFEAVMWAVIQHSNLEIMGRYLPIIQKAVEDKELNIVPFKMLIDRFYGLKYGYQIFGSQSGFGFDMADDKTREKIKEKYGIE